MVKLKNAWACVLFSKNSTKSIHVGYRRATVLRFCNRQALPQKEEQRERDKNKRRRHVQQFLNGKQFFSNYLAIPGLVKRAVLDPPSAPRGFPIYYRNGCWSLMSTW